LISAPATRTRVGAARQPPQFVDDLGQQHGGVRTVELHHPKRDGAFGQVKVTPPKRTKRLQPWADIGGEQDRGPPYRPELGAERPGCAVGQPVKILL
jgi:hypothetical protein